jgi:secreted trypsin-like serine protease
MCPLSSAGAHLVIIHIKGSNIMFRQASLAAGAALAVLSAHSAAQAVVVAGTSSGFSRHAGISRLTITYGGGSSSNTSTATCTGTLLPSGQHILTAAHCLTDRDGNLDVLGTSATFVSPHYGQTTVGVASDGYYIYSGWDGFSGGDIAVLKLSNTVPIHYERHNIYRRSDEAGRFFQVAGFGKTGFGQSGATTNNPGTFATGQNRFDIALESFGPIMGSQLLFDFDSGSPQHDTSGQVFGIRDLGIGGFESTIAFGDSGGPAFIDGQIAGVSSYILSPGQPIDIDDQLNSSFGELAGAMRVSSYAQFIDAAVAGRIASTQKGQTTSRSTTSGNVALISYNYTDGDFVIDAPTYEAESVPEPTSALGLLAVGLSGAGLLSRKRKQQTNES